VLWWVQERHVPVAAVAGILAAGDLAISLLELPTGWFADRFGHRVSLIAGSALQIAGMLLAWQGRGIAGVLAACLVIAIADTLRSGADQALLYRSCLAAGDTGFQRREAHTRALQHASLVCLVLAGGAIVQAWGFDAAWLLETLLSVAGLAIACAMAEPPAQPDAPPLDDDEASDAVDDAPHRSTGLTALLLLILPVAVLDGASTAGLFFVQSAADSQPLGMTLIIAVATLAEAAGAFVGARLPTTLSMQVAIAAAGLTTAIAAFAVPGVFHPAIVATCLLTGAAGPVRAAAIQRVAADRMRARAASLASACDKVLSTVALVLAGLAQRPRSR
jgi:hypothetical protein